MKRIVRSPYIIAFVAAVGAAFVFASLRASVAQVPSHAWVQTGDMGQARAGAAAVLIGDGVVLVSGGMTGDSVSASAERYSAFGGTFVAAVPMQVVRAGHTATLLADGRVLVAGGVGADGAEVDSAEIYDASTNSWTFAGSLAIARAGHTATLLDGGGVLIAGARTPPDRTRRSRSSRPTPDCSGSSSRS